MSGSKTNEKVEKTRVADPAEKIEQQSDAGVEVSAQPQGEGALNAVEVTKFEECERQIGQNLGGFMLVGRALKAIDDGRLYRAKFNTFPDYCREKWGMSDKYAYRQIKGYTCVTQLEKEISPIGETRFPTNESQVRPLTSLERSQWVKAWQQVLKACEGKPITGDEVQTVVDKMAGKQTSAKKSAKPDTKSTKAEQKLVKIRKLVTETLKIGASKLTVPKLRGILERIQKMLKSGK